MTISNDLDSAPMDAEPTAAAEPAEEQPTQLGDAVEGETQSIHAWSLADDAEVVIPHRRSWKLPIALAAAALVAVGGAGIYAAWPEHNAPTQKPSSAPLPTAKPLPPPAIQPPVAVAPPVAPSVVIQPGWPTAWKNAARAFEQVPPPPGQCYAEDGSPFTWENFIGPAVNCTAPVGAQTGGFAPLPPRDRGLLPQDPDVRRQFGDVPTEAPAPAPSCTERSCPGGNF